jgi:hypothetical protein
LPRGLKEQEHPACRLACWSIAGFRSVAVVSTNPGRVCASAGRDARPGCELKQVPGPHHSQAFRKILGEWLEQQRHKKAVVELRHQAGN